MKNNVLMCLCVLLFASSQIRAQKEKELIQSDSIYFVVEQMPSFPGGDSEMMKYVGVNFNIGNVPSEELKATRVVARFYVDIDGTIKDAKITRSSHPVVDSIFLKIITDMPKWTAGKQDGKAVPVYFTLPLLFRPKYKSETY